MGLVRGLLVRGIDEAEDLAVLLVDPVVLVVDPVLALDLHVGGVGADDVLGLDAGDVVLVHVERHAETPWCSCGPSVRWRLGSAPEPRVASVDRPMACHPWRPGGKPAATHLYAARARTGS